jgi:hypothetical protein
MSKRLALIQSDYVRITRDLKTDSYLSMVEAKVMLILSTNIDVPLPAPDPLLAYPDQHAVTAAFNTPVRLFSAQPKDPSGPSNRWY